MAARKYDRRCKCRSGRYDNGDRYTNMWTDEWKLSQVDIEFPLYCIVKPVAPMIIGNDDDARR